MIEYALLFALGFVTAMLAGLLLAPAIHRRVVKFTENRIIATMPVSPGELRAQKDMVRAEMAASVARTGHDLKHERGKAATLSIQNDQLIQQAGGLASENFDLRTSMEALDHEAGEIRAALRQEEMHVVSLREQLSEGTIRDRAKEDRISQLLGKIQQLDQDVGNLKIDIATRDTEAESFRSRINALRDERETLRNDLRLTTQRAKDAELRLAREENKSARLEDRLNSEISGSVDKDTIIERRLSEVNRLKERLKAANAEVRETARKPAITKLPPPERIKTLPSNVRRATLEDLRSDEPAKLVEATPPALLPESAPLAMLPTRLIDEKRASELSDEARNQANAVSDVLLKLENDDRDDALRIEIADIAAKMMAIVAQKEGMSSPIRSMLSGRPQDNASARLSLSNRASALMHQE
jgi:DNA repair exonuclease SbcCD ATPase subunit